MALSHDVRSPQARWHRVLGDPLSMAVEWVALGVSMASLVALAMASLADVFDWSAVADAVDGGPSLITSI